MRCPDCQDTGYLTTGYDIGIPVRDNIAADEHVQWIMSLIACTHPRKASRKGRGGTDDSRTAVVGAHRQPEARQVTTEADPGPGDLPATGGTG